MFLERDNDDASFEDISPVGANADEAKATNEDEDNEVHFSHSVLPSAALDLTIKFTFRILSCLPQH